MFVSLTGSECYIQCERKIVHRNSGSISLVKKEQHEDTAFTTQLARVATKTIRRVLATFLTYMSAHPYVPIPKRACLKKSRIPQATTPPEQAKIMKLSDREISTLSI